MSQKTIPIASLAKKFSRSPIRAIFDDAQTLEERGEEITRLEIGEPDFDTPSHICEAAKDALDRGETHYTANAGRIDLRELLSDKLREENDIEANPKNQIVVTAGAMEGLLLSMISTVDKGEEVLVPDPGWPNFVNQVKMVGGKPVRYKLRPEDNFQIRLEQLKELINKDTKGMIVNTPSNPLGTMLNEEILQGLAELAVDEDIVIYADETYEKLVYGEENDHVSVGSFEEAKDRVLTIHSFSKAYAMTGWRIGYIAGNEEYMHLITKLRESSSSCTSSIAQAGAMEALKHGEKSVERMRSIYRERRDMVVDYLNEMSGVSCFEPQGTFYVFPSFSNLSESSMKLAKNLLYEEHVATVPGSGFGEMGEGFLRISFATGKNALKRGLAGIRSYVEKKV